LSPIAEGSSTIQKRSWSNDADYEEQEQYDDRSQLPKKQVKKRKGNVPVKSVKDKPQVFPHLCPLSFIITIFSLPNHFVDLHVKTYQKLRFG